ncbi:MAG TPA: hypothetical protein VN894_09750 [Polyangiaceae bacterium]|nr:hypothetical protein [Polyangiaceae bacterium]
MSPSSLIGRSLRRYAPFLALSCAVAVAASCAKKLAPSSDFDGGGGGGGEGPVGDGGPATTIGTATPMGLDGSGGGPMITIRPDASNAKCSADHPCQDFPASPEFAGAAPMNAPMMFGGAGTGSTTGGPCLAEPADGALYPKNWLRPRVLWAPASATQTLFEVRVHADGEANDYVVYTDKTSWTMPSATWKTIAYTGGTPSVDGNLMGKPLTVTVRGMSATGGMPSVSNSATITIAPAIADGALIFWTSSSFAKTSTNTTLQGFHVGDEGTTQALVASDVLQPVRAQSVDGGNLGPAAYNGVFCIGCHTATPDGQYVSFTSQWPWATALASVATGPGAPAVGSPPPWLTTGAASNLSPNINGYYAPPSVNQVMMGIQTFSPAHYTTGDRRLVAAVGAAWNQTEAQILAASPGLATGVVSQLVWFDLEWAGALPAGTPYNPWSSGMLTSPLPLAVPCAGVGCAAPAASAGGWGIIARTGDNASAGGPNWSHNVDGMTDFIAYGSTNVGTKDGRMDCEMSGATCTSDVFVVPYNNGAGGVAKPLPGASKPDQSEYYPAWSPDDKLIAFNRVPTGTSMYNAPKADIYVVAYNGGAGGTEQALTSNTPVACTGAAPQTVQNTWPKWAPNPLSNSGDGGAGVPTPQVVDGKTYYWITFSSTRSPTSAHDPNNGNKRFQQLYVAGIVLDNTTQAITTYAPIYLWNQDFTVNNLIPAWGEFSIPPGLTLPPPDAGIAR